LNSFFYKTQWLNFERYGRSGVSPVAGLGEYPLSSWFHLTLLSSWFYAGAGAVTTLLGALVWVLLHLVWLDMVAWEWGVVITAILLFSSTSFAMAFARQNYNILGWMWLPLALYAVLNGQWALAALAWLVASLASITVVFAALPLMLIYSICVGQWEGVLSMLPAILKLGFHLVPMLYGGGIKTGLLGIGKMIGLTSVGVRYRRTSMRLGMVNLYLIATYAIACGLMWWGQKTLPILPLTALGMFVINQRLIRFADDQSVIILFITVFSAALLSSPRSWISLMGLLLAANTLPAFLGLVSAKLNQTLVRVPSFRPYDHEPILSGIEKFLMDVPKGSRIYFAFNDPAGVYERIFDGYRNLLELPLFVAATRDIHLFPDWYAVAETNYQGAPNCWGRTPEKVLENAVSWGARYVVIYQDSATELAAVWNNLGFVEQASFDWGEWSSELQEHNLWSSESPPKWWILEVPAQQPKYMRSTSH
jgi:hypothetical protein